MDPTRRQIALPLIGLAAAGLIGAAPPAEDGLPYNVFISPCGQPFRARRGDDYPVVNWFRQADRNGDGKLDHAEFVADAAAFFQILDLNADGVIDRYETGVYETKIAPEVLGGHVQVGWLGEGWNSRLGARKWLAQREGPDPGAGEPAPGGAPPVKGLDESGAGASPFSFFPDPEPVAAADINFNGRITKSNFLKLADVHFTALDEDRLGYLTLASLPKTQVQQILEQARPKRRRKS